jgi:hypothetical protein
MIIRRSSSIGGHSTNNVLNVIRSGNAGSMVNSFSEVYRVSDAPGGGAICAPFIL